MDAAFINNLAHSIDHYFSFSLFLSLFLPFFLYALQVGKSYGKLNAKERDQYEQWNCNSVAEGRNPSCDDVGSSIVVVVLGSKNMRQEGVLSYVSHESHAVLMC